MIWILLSAVGGLLVGLFISNLINRSKFRPLGRIILSYDGALYAELNDADSLTKLKDLNYATFAVKRE